MFCYFNTLNGKTKCACGCGELINKYDKRGRKRMYKLYHSSKAIMKDKKVIERIRKTNTGKKRSDETRKKQSEKRKEFYKNGGIHPRLGVKLSDEQLNKMRKKRWTKENRIKQSQIMTEINNNFYKNGGIHPLKDKKRSKEVIKKIKNAWTPELRKYMSNIRRNGNNIMNNTKPERFMKSILSVNGIEYESQKLINLGDLSFKCDIYIPSKNLVIECDGCYWHGCKRCHNEKYLDHPQIRKKISFDFLVNGKLSKHGYKVIRFWEHDINENLVKCFEVINSL